MNDLINIHKNVTIGENPVIGNFVILGEPGGEEEQGTIIGKNAVIRSHTVIYSGNIIGDDFKTGHGALIRPGNKIGNNVVIGSNAKLEGLVEVRDGATIHSQSIIGEKSLIEEQCWVGPNVVLISAKYPASKGSKERWDGVHVKKKARIGANVTVSSGVTIGENSLVGAGSVVTKDVPDNTVVAGSPARVINSIDNLPYE